MTISERCISPKWFSQKLKCISQECIFLRKKYFKKWRDPRRRHAGEGSSDGMSGGPKSRVFKIWSNTLVHGRGQLIFNPHFQGCRGAAAMWAGEEMKSKRNPKPKWVENELFAEWCLAQFLAPTAQVERKGKWEKAAQGKPLQHLTPVKRLPRPPPSPT